MSTNLQTQAFAGNPIRSKTPKSTDPFSPTSALESLKTRLLDNTLHCQPQKHHSSLSSSSSSSHDFKVLPFRKGRPLTYSGPGETAPVWHLGWISLGDCKIFLANSGIELKEEALVYLGSRSADDVVYWAIDVSDGDSLASEFGSKQLCFVELRTLMVATDWADQRAMADLAIAGHVSSHGVCSYSNAVFFTVDLVYMFRKSLACRN